MPRPPLTPAAVGRLAAVGLLGVLTVWLGTAQHLARTEVLGVLVPTGLLLALALVVATDVAVAAAVPPRARPGPTAHLLALVAGRLAGLLVLLPPTPEGDLVLTGLPVTTVWLLVAVLLPAFAAPLLGAVEAARAARAMAARGPGT
ncbi:hypothetical protein [Aquipuribacter nitratireducens]|uniref:Uncharacterized protein n=1 Tax=Aquipuribacter nitratireducens TaxID=650104 RepID=A0ABW0GM10_9MICO